MTSGAACSTDACCSLRVLVVEDDPEVLDATLEALELLGHWATGVRSAEGAIDRFLEGAFDVLMADVGLPGLSGLELADKLQTRCGLPIIFATASQAPERPITGTVWLCKPSASSSSAMPCAKPLAFVLALHPLRSSRQRPPRCRPPAPFWHAEARCPLFGAGGRLSPAGNSRRPAPDSRRACEGPRAAAACCPGSDPWGRGAARRRAGG